MHTHTHRHAPVLAILLLVSITSSISISIHIYIYIYIYRERERDTSADGIIGGCVRRAAAEEAQRMMRSSVSLGGAEARRGPHEGVSGLIVVVEIESSLSLRTGHHPRAC